MTQQTLVHQTAWPFPAFAFPSQLRSSKLGYSVVASLRCASYADLDRHRVRVFAVALRKLHPTTSQTFQSGD